MAYSDLRYFGLGMVAATAFALATQLLLIQWAVGSRVVVLLLVVLLGIGIYTVGGLMEV